MIELMVVLAILTMGVSMFSSTLVSTARQSQAKREIAIAAEGARQAMELMRSQDCTTLFATYNENAADDPAGAGTAPGRHFEVRGLTLCENDADGFAGEIRFPTIESALREDVVDALLGMPRDLDCDGDVDSANHSTDYLLLPVHVRIRWKGVAGDMSFDLYNQFVRQ